MLQYVLYVLNSIQFRSYVMHSFNEVIPKKSSHLSFTYHKSYTDFWDGSHEIWPEHFQESSIQTQIQIILRGTGRSIFASIYSLSAFFLPKHDRFSTKNHTVSRFISCQQFQIDILVTLRLFFSTTCF